jgi:hypothetical protein
MNLGPPQRRVGPENVWRAQVSNPIVGPHGRVMVSHLCGHVEDLKALALHIVVEWWWGRLVLVKRK